MNLINRIIIMNLQIKNLFILFILNNGIQLFQCIFQTNKLLMEPILEHRPIVFVRYKVVIDSPKISILFN